MYRCAECKVVQQPRTPSHAKVVETRERQYHNIDAGGEPVVSIGSEIVKEIRVCPSCIKGG